jgi:hypothetical protein
MLQIGAQAFRFQRAPDRILVHGSALLRPLGELGGVHGEVRLHAFDDGRVVVVEDLRGRLVLCKPTDTYGAERARCHTRGRGGRGVTYSAIAGFEAV